MLFLPLGRSTFLTRLIFLLSEECVLACFEGQGGCGDEFPR